jgi:hypothetical protein
MLASKVWKARPLPHRRSVHSPLYPRKPTSEQTWLMSALCPEGDILNQREYATPGQPRLTCVALALGHSLRALYRLPHTVRRRGHVNAVDAKWSQRINDRIDDDRRSTDSAGFADTFHANRIGLAANFF